MAVKNEWIRYGTGSGFFALPEKATTPLPAVLVIQEIWGVNDQIEDVTRRLAMAGYAALAPDLFAGEGDRPAALTRERLAETYGFLQQLPPGSLGNPPVRDAELAKLPETLRARLSETMTQMMPGAPGRMESLLGSVRVAFRHVRTERPETRGQQVACVGFCMGGGLSALLACEEPELSGAVIYYGSSPAAEKVPAIRCPVLGFYGSKDQRVNAGVPAFAQAMKEKGKSFEHHIYEGAAHGFFNDDGAGYDVRASRDSWARMLQFFAKTIGS
jgi:carboxymethylenebutenolidase